MLSMKRVIRIGLMTLLALLVAQAPTNASLCKAGFCWYSPYTQTQTLVGTMPNLFRSFTPSHSTGGAAYQQFVFRATGWRGLYLGAGRSPFIF
jgi:hypothetical protein